MIFERAGVAERLVRFVSVCVGNRAGAPAIVAVLVCMFLGGISGSGPTIFALVDHHEVAAKTRDWMAANYQKNARGFVHVCRADLGCARSVD